MEGEKRRSKRIDLNVTMKINTLQNFEYLIPVKSEFEVEVVNISKDGIAFKSPEILLLNTCYNANVVLWTKETFQSLIEIVRMESNDDGNTLYGCRFVGISTSNQFKIDVYQLVNNMETN
jgi:c-di-GMP-binding flagellar brake protein YcgR